MEQFGGRKLLKKTPASKNNSPIAARNYRKYLNKQSGKSPTDKKNIRINRKRPISPKKSRKISHKEQALFKVGGGEVPAPAAGPAAPEAPAAPNDAPNDAPNAPPAAAPAAVRAAKKKPKKLIKRSKKSTKRHTKRNNSRQVKVSKPTVLTDEHIKRVEKKIQNIRKQKLSDMKKELEKRGVRTTGKSNRLLKDIFLYSKMCNINIQHEK